MEILSTTSQMRSWSDDQIRKFKSIGFVPTMGYLHEGHLALVNKARAENERVVASIFVNPAQFSPNEDLARYPRDFDGDREKLAAVGVDALFFPSAEELYGPGYETYVEVKNVSNLLCGLNRPGHFRGVATIVLKLFNLVRPAKAYFGQKDFQQLRVIRTMVRDLNLDLEIVGCPIVREPSGLAMSSRNAYLSDDEIRQACCLYSSLMGARRSFVLGETSSAVLVQGMVETISKEPDAAIDYARIVNPTNLEDVAEANSDSVAVLAVRIGNVRLIDNMTLGE